MLTVGEPFWKSWSTSCTQGCNIYSSGMSEAGSGCRRWCLLVPCSCCCSASHRVEDYIDTPIDAISVRTLKMSCRSIFLHTIRKIILDREIKLVINFSLCAANIMTCPSNGYFSFDFALLGHQSEGK